MRVVGQAGSSPKLGDKILARPTEAYSGLGLNWSIQNRAGGFMIWVSSGGSQAARAGRSSDLRSVRGAIRAAREQRMTLGERLWLEFVAELSAAAATAPAFLSTLGPSGGSAEEKDREGGGELVVPSALRTAARPATLMLSGGGIS
ncbi:uncharacterized protein A4U43_C03F16830 [Asparagus officinalis]|uniref:Uncharacterized protein n=1 Tax=Asparagus officinalis TaxID=4686 RepID=A0A5P1FDJ0_ASPOF|nr:uncharacterized protein A4U43_C03F16830 [Asparagus officinalis]